MNTKEYMRVVESEFNRRNSINYFDDIDAPVSDNNDNKVKFIIHSKTKAEGIKELKQTIDLEKENALSLLVGQPGYEGLSIDDIKKQIESDKVNNKRILINHRRYLEGIINRNSLDFQKFIENIDNESENIKEKAVDSFEKAEEVILNIKIDKYFNVKLKKEFKSDLFNLDFPIYINKLKNEYDNEDNKIKKGYRLFIKYPTVWKKGGDFENHHEMINIITLYSLFFKLDYIEALKDLMRVFNITIKGRLQTMIKKEKDKYANNIFFIREELQKYNNVYSLIGKYSFLLEYINYSSLKYTTNINYAYDKNNIFYLPVRRLNKDLIELEEKLNIKITYKATGSINRVLNMFITLGLLKEISVFTAKQVGLDTTKTSINHYNKKFYATVKMDSKLLRQAEKIAKLLLSNNITTGTISYSNLLKIDEELAKDVFQNTHNTIINKDLVDKAIKQDKQDDNDNIPDLKIVNNEDIITYEINDDIPF